MVPRVKEWGKGNCRKVVKSYRLPVLRQKCTKDAVYKKITIANTAVRQICKKNCSG